MHKNLICLDPSCFTSLEKLRDAKHFLNEIGNEGPWLEVYVPTMIHRAINLEPSQKFRELPRILKDWIIEYDPEDINSMDRDKQDDYVFVMKEFLELHKPSPVKDLIGDISKIGRESLYLDDLIRKFDRFTGEILFEMASISNEFNAKILTIGEKTISLFKIIGTRIIKGASQVKKQIKNKQRIRTPINIMMYFFVPATPIYTFIQEYQIHGIEGLLNPTLASLALPLGWLLVGNS